MSDDLIPFARVPDHIPGGRVNPATLHRWRTRGVAGVKLDVEFIGGRVFVARSELPRFFEAIKAARSAKQARSEPQTANRRGKIAAAKRRVGAQLAPTRKSQGAA
jgi:hypothetical protein